ncbi:MAG: M23 family metallopeptidase, partial [Hyphomicrobiales bacterium]|nr:M23 family metallopeptidase [Hyphomicrobiales bacterium]
SLGGIAVRYGVRRSDIMRANNIENPDHIRIGQRLTIPSAGTSTVAYGGAGNDDAITTASISLVATVSAPHPPRKPLHTASIRAQPDTGMTARAEGNGGVPTPTSRPGRSVSGYASGGNAGARAEETRVATTPAAIERSQDGVSFRWPVRGRIVSSFGSSTDGERNDGINLAVPEGTSVKAAEDGVVVYSGNELKGFGNLVLIKHKDGWVTAYAHNSELMVQRGDRVNRGQIIGKAGKTGAVTSPQVHFELRKGSKPVDPNLYLTSS